jgi:aminoglycoside phosphotransferase (APT) family kinase protein
MGAMPMHADEIEIPESLVRSLVDRQFPEWAALPLRPVTAFGTDHRLFRLGEELLVRMPVYAGSADQAISDATWLPRLAPHLPVVVPVPVAVGEPNASYPFAWSVVPWLPGEPLEDVSADNPRLAADLAEFVLALRDVDPSDGPRPTGTARGMALDPQWPVEDTILEHADLIDVDRARAVWREALDAGPWPGPGVWIHGDLLGGNLLVRDGRLSAVIDWGPLKVGDPAPDVVPAWTLLEGEARRTYREQLAVDDATWARARAWVMLPALAGIRYYEKTVPAFSQRSRRHLDAVLGDVGVQTTG